MYDSKKDALEKLTGIRSSKKNYYMELKKTIQEVTRQNVQLEIINKLVRSITIDMSFQDMMKEVISKLREVILFDRLALLSMESNELRITHVFPDTLTELKYGEKIPQKDSLYWESIYKNTPIYHHVSSECNQYFEDTILRNLKIKTVMVFPLIIKKQPIGVLSLGCRDKVDFHQNDINFLSQVADHLSICIDNASLYTKMANMRTDLQNIFDAVTDMLMQVDLHSRIVHFNHAVPKFFNKSPEQIMLQKWNDLFYNGETPLTSSPLEEVLTTNTSMTHRIHLKNGKILDVFSHPKYNDGKLSGIICYVKDITTKLALEQQLIQSAKLAAIGEMAAGVAHEINSPLTAILGNTQLLMMEADPKSEETELLSDIYNCGVRSKKIIQNLLTFSRQDHYAFEETCLNTTAKQALNIVGYQINRNKIAIHLHLSKALPTIFASKQHIEQIIINFILNAKDALVGIPNGEIHIETGTVSHDIPLLLYEKNKNIDTYAYIAVRDNGCGIPPENLPQVFNPFFTTKDSTKGTGLGLSVSLGIADAHNGTILIDSKINEGSTFTLYIPVDGKGGVQ